MMDIDTQISSDKSIFTILISGDFNFSGLHMFKASYDNNDARAATKVVVDFRNTETIDSSALGMLLNMQKTLAKKHDDMTIVNSNDVISKILTITNFSKKFKIE